MTTLYFLCRVQCRGGAGAGAGRGGVCAARALSRRIRNAILMRLKGTSLFGRGHCFLSASRRKPMQTAPRADTACLSALDWLTLTVALELIEITSCSFKYVYLVFRMNQQ